MKRLVILLGVMFALAGWSFGFEPGWLQQRQLALTAPGWTGKPLTIATRDTNGRAVAFELKPEGFPEGLKRLRALEAGAK